MQIENTREARRTAILVLAVVFLLVLVCAFASPDDYVDPTAGLTPGERASGLQPR